MNNRVFIYQTNFTDSRSNFHDLVVASSEQSAERIATVLVRDYDATGYGMDPDATVNIICELASDAASIAEDLSDLYK